ncbi:MAG: SpoIIE family protein phosphatase [Bacteroidota bacterium]
MAARSIRTKLLTNFLLISLVPTILVLLILNIVVGSSIKSEIIEKIKLSRDLEKEMVVDYFTSYMKELEYFATGKSPVDHISILLEAFRDLEVPELKEAELVALKARYDSVARSFNATGLVEVNSEDFFPEEPVTRAFQYKYMIDENSYTFPEYESKYSDIHKGVGIITDKFDLTDILIIDNKSGYVCYSDNKGMDFGINLEHSRYAHTTIKKVFHMARELGEGESVMTDFIRYLTAGMEPRLFFAAPVHKDGQSIATLVFQINNTEFDGFMSHQEEWEAQGLEKTGESYIIGEDRLMRTSSRFYLEDPDDFIHEIRPIVGDSLAEQIETAASTILTLPVHTDASRNALHGNTATTSNTDYRGIKVLSSYTPIEIKGVKWALISEIDHREAFAPIRRFNLLLLILLLIVTPLVFFLAAWISKRFLRPINVLMRGTREVNKDNLEVSLEPVTNDEFRTLTVMFNKMVSSIRTNREELKDLYNQVSEKQREITDSIRYALRIQHAALPEGKLLKDAFDDSFVLYRPKDIVSGDFYWYHQVGDRFVVIAADCTGHGVPGSFISLLGIRFLRRAVIDDGIVQPDLILARLRDELVNFFRKVTTQDVDEIKDGMDLAVCTYDTREKILEYAGAYNQLYLMRGGEVITYKADRHAVSAQSSDENRPFTSHRISVQKDDTFYIFSDGYQDQLGGPAGKKFMSKKFRELLLDIHQKSMHDQQDILQERLDGWMEHTEQTDDILVMGFKPI